MRRNIVEKQQPFEALSKICLNNWHYIDRKILTLSEGINFFTGHSGSGKSTVLDAMQIVLYADTDGRRFFNKAAADDSDRSLIEYLRGMVNISENNESQYLRNKNFSSTIVLEFERTDTKDKQCVGVVFDVETATNEISRQFFWHTGGLLENQYRAEKRCLTTVEMKEYLSRTFTKEQYYCGSSNERFRRQLYDVYLGGLDIEKFPRLFKRAIPFKMNIKLEDFVKEYICMEQDIHIEDLQESVMQYGRMQSKIAETMKEIRYLTDIREAYQSYEEKQQAAESCDYQVERLELLQLQRKSKELRERIIDRTEGIKQQQTQQEKLNKELKELQKDYEDILYHIAKSGYDSLQMELGNLNEVLERLENSKARIQKLSKKLNLWKDKEVTPNQTIWDIEKFEKGTITEGELERLQKSLLEIRDSLETERTDTVTTLNRIKKEEKEIKEELRELKQGKKAYPRELEEARFELRKRLHERVGKLVNVQILADLLDVKDERWHNAVEGYLGNNKLLLIVEPKYAKDAMEIYREMDKRKFFRAAVLDTERVNAEEFAVQKGALAEEVEAKESYVQAYIRFVLGNVKKCESIEELRDCKIGITSDCVLYKGFRMQHINPDNYTRRAYIGETSMRKRILQLERKQGELQNERLPLQEMLEEIKRILEFEMLLQPTADYMQWQNEAGQISEKEKRKAHVIEQMKKLREESVDMLEKQKLDIVRRQEEKKESIDSVKKAIWQNEQDIEKFNNMIITTETEWLEREKMLAEENKRRSEERTQMLESQFKQYLEKTKSLNYDYMKRQKQMEQDPLKDQMDRFYQKLVDVRSVYNQQYPNRSFSTSVKDNKMYDKLLDSLTCEDLERYRASAQEQAKSAVEHFKDDFIFKIRSAIREAYQRRDELNRIISRLDFGKDKYQFVITKNKGADGKYYKMFMDDALQIDPHQLSGSMDNQMNMFTMEHEEEYGEMMNELIHIFIPPENATKEEQDEARKNMEKYADYRTYLSFDMQQIVHGEKDMKIGLSKMIKKNSGGEGQNPLYVALLASFAQVYRVNLSPKLRRNPTLRLVVLDEAFSKMDAEKVASCISLIRGLGFQAIISATNDKIQNYLENVDKTFVYANPNKKHISIQEFEKTEFGQLTEEA